MGLLEKIGDYMEQISLRGKDSGWDQETRLSNRDEGRLKLTAFARDSGIAHEVHQV